MLVKRETQIRGNPYRDRIIRAIRRGKRRWKESVGYGKRWLVEGFFSSFKRWFGEYVSSVKFENIRRELVFKVAIVNMFLAMSL
jgi:transposase